VWFFNHLKLRRLHFFITLVYLCPIKHNIQEAISSRGREKMAIL